MTGINLSTVSPFLGILGPYGGPLSTPQPVELIGQSVHGASPAEVSNEGFIPQILDADSPDDYGKAVGTYLQQKFNISHKNPLIKLVATPFDGVELGFQAINPIADKIQPYVARLPATITDRMTSLTTPFNDIFGNKMESLRKVLEPYWSFTERYSASLPFLKHRREAEQIHEQPSVIDPKGGPTAAECQLWFESTGARGQGCELYAERVGFGAPSLDLHARHSADDFDSLQESKFGFL